MGAPYGVHEVLHLYVCTYILTRRLGRKGPEKLRIDALAAWQPNTATNIRGRIAENLCSVIKATYTDMAIELP